MCIRDSSNIGQFRGLAACRIALLSRNTKSILIFSKHVRLLEFVCCRGLSLLNRQTWGKIHLTSCPIGEHVFFIESFQLQEIQI